MNPETIILLILGVVLGVICVVKYCQYRGLEAIRADVYQAFLEAEHAFKQGENYEKFEFVLDLAKSAIPVPFNLFITENLLRVVIQAWFDLIKDLLDDGKINGTKGE